jgi:hypothetical protein
VLAVVTAGYARWAFIVAAVVVPYIAVVIANAGARADPEGPEPFVPDARPMLPPGSDHARREDPTGQDSPGEDPPDPTR